MSDTTLGFWGNVSVKPWAFDIDRGDETMGENSHSTRNVATESAQIVVFTNGD